MDAGCSINSANSISNDKIMINNSNSSLSLTKDLPSSVIHWTENDVHRWHQKLPSFLAKIPLPSLNGELLLLLRESDISDWLSECNLILNTVVHRKTLYHHVRKLQLANISVIEKLGYDPSYIISGIPHERGNISVKVENLPSKRVSGTTEHIEENVKNQRQDNRATKFKPELWKTFISMLYLFFVTWLTAFVMVIVHNRVPDMKKYPPLPDIFLDNVPHIPWAFAMCEFTATLMLFIWLSVLLFHKHRFILMRRFFAISGTVFLLRCVTMLITSLSVPGSHLQCSPMPEEIKEKESIWSRMQQAYIIWSGAGLSIQGVRTCGDYMFSGHTAALTILNFFITEYTPRHLYFMHTFSWMLNMFGIFFILSAHEHYSIDVFIAFYITSRLFLYYHTLANNQALMQRDSTRTRIWFPLFSFFESEIDGIIPNDFDTPSSLIASLCCSLRELINVLYSVSMRRTFPKKTKKD